MSQNFEPTLATVTENNWTQSDLGPILQTIFGTV